MKIAVCISHVPDTTTRIKIGSSGKQIEESGVQWILNPWDELALTRALELKEKHPGIIQDVTVVTAGPAAVEPTLRKALAIGADQAARIEGHPLDSFQTARMLSDYFQTHPFDIILTGIESADFNGSAVGPMLSAYLQYRLVPNVSGLDLEEENIIVNHEWDGASHKFRLKGPLVLVVQKGIAIVPRIPSMRGIMASRTKPLTLHTPDATQALAAVSGFQPIPPRAACKMIDAGQAGKLIDLLHNEAKVI